MVSKFFRIDKMSEVDLEPQSQKLYFKDHPDGWKELFIFFCVMPFTEYEFQGKGGSLLNPDTLHNACPSDATDNLLIRTFSDIEFMSSNQSISDSRLAAYLQTILKTNIFSNTFNEDHRTKLISSLLYVGFNLRYNLVTDLSSTDEDTYRENFKDYLFKPVCEYVAALLGFEINSVEQESIPKCHIKLMIYYISSYDKWKHRRCLAVVEVKKVPLLQSHKVLNFNDPKIISFFIQLVAEMFSNHINKGMLTDSYTAILVEIDIERSLQAIEQKQQFFENKAISLNYKILDCHSSGLTLRGGLISFIYEAFSANETRLNEVKRGLDKIYRYIRKTDEEYLTYLDELAAKNEEAYKSFCKDVYKAKGKHLYDTVIGLGEFADIDIQSGFTFNSQLFKVSSKDVIEYLKEDINVTHQLIVKVFDPIKAKRDHDSYTVSKTGIFDKSRRAYSCEKIAYEMLMSNDKFNSTYIDQECVFGKFNIGEHYHALGPFLILKYLDHTKCPLDEDTYKKAEEQLEIIHCNQIIHGDISLRNILFCEGKVYFIDFGYSNYDDYHDSKGKQCRPVSANEGAKKSEHRELCEVFGQPIPEKYN